MMMSGNRVKEECITMHQPWASLLVQGIKRVEGRSWPAPLRGRLWIHAASKVPDSATIKAMEDFYREIYAIHGITDLKFPDHYPVSRLLGCVEVVGCVRRQELACWQDIPEGVRLEALTDFCWLCEQPQRLFIPIEMRGYQGVYPLDEKMVEAAIRGLALVQSPQAVKFPLPDARDPFSLKPGSISIKYPEYKASKVELPSSLIAAIAGAIAAATQFSKKNQTPQATRSIVGLQETKSFQVGNGVANNVDRRFRTSSIYRQTSQATCFSKKDPLFSNDHNFRPNTIQIRYEPKFSRVDLQGNNSGYNGLANNVDERSCTGGSYKQSSQTTQISKKDRNSEATQFPKDRNFQRSTIQRIYVPKISRDGLEGNKSFQVGNCVANKVDESFCGSTLVEKSGSNNEVYIQGQDHLPQRKEDHKNKACPKIFAAAVRELRLAEAKTGD